MNSGEWPYILLGCIGACFAGASWPVSALVFSEVTVILQEDNNESKVRFWSLMFIVVGVGSLIGNVMQMGFLAISGEKLTRKLRAASFRALLKQEMGFFDKKENSVGALSTRLATDASFVKGLAGDSLGMISVTLATIGAGLIVAFTGCWRLALVVLAMLPFMAIAGFYQMKMMTGFDSGSKKEYVSAGSVASEAVDNVSTVTSLGVQDVFIERYNASLVKPYANGRKGAFVGGVAFGFAEFCMFSLWAIAFWVGSKFIEQGHCDFLGVMKAVNGYVTAQY